MCVIILFHVFLTNINLGGLIRYSVMSVNQSNWAEGKVENMKVGCVKR